MVLKRPLTDGGEGSSELPDRELKRQHFFATASGDSENDDQAQFWRRMETLIRTVMREEIPPFLRPSQNQIESSGSRTLQLRFDCELPGTIFTGNRILSKDGITVKIGLYDSGSKNIITSRSLSSLKVDVVVLDGDFSPDDQNNWTEKEFVSKTVPNREGKRPLLTGELTVQLKEGVGYIGEAIFTDNSSWTRSGSFRLGVKVNANYNIREGVSRAFKVKDNRGESYQKHYPPSLDDEVWRLEKIAKGGAYHDRLAKSGISTVGDFLRSYDTDPSWLQSLLKISNKKWDAIIGHAKKCKLYPSIGADNVNYPSSSMQNANFPVEQVEPEYNPMQGFNPTLEDGFGINVSHSGSYMGADTLASGVDYAGSYTSIPDDPSADDFQIDDWFQGSEMGALLSNPGIRKKTRWCKVLAVVKWCLFRRNVAA